MSDQTDFKHALRTLADDEGWGAGSWDPRRGEHPPAEDLSAYGEGGLDTAARERIQEHLTTCARCAGLVADQALFPALPAADDEPGEFEIAAGWRKLQRRLDTEGLRPAPNRGGSAGLLRHANVAWSVAAGLLLACLLLGVWNLQLGERIAALTAPQPNVPLADLDDGLTRSAGEPEVVAVNPRGPSYVLIAYASNPEGFSDDHVFADYRWWIVDGEGRELLSGSGLEDQGLGVFTLQLHRDSLSPGLYRLWLSGITENGEEVPLGDLPFRIAGE